MKNHGRSAVVALASRLDREPVASLLVRPDWAWALGQRPGVARVELSRATLRVRSASGVGPPIVFLIDPPNTVEHYDALIQILAQHARVVCVELPGFGFSTRSITEQRVVIARAPARPRPEAHPVRDRATAPTR